MAERQIVRILNADITGEKQLYDALTKITGVGYSFSNAICNLLNISKTKKIGSLSDAELKKVEDIIKDPAKYKLPVFLFNRRRDVDTGEDKHISGTNVSFLRDMDIKKMKKIKSYKGIRHALGLPVRGQSTKHHFREGKTVGVKKKSIVIKTEEKKKKE